MHLFTKKHLALFCWLIPSIALAQIDITVALAPQAYLVERIGQQFVTINVLVKAGQTPHTFEASPRQLVDLGKSRLYFTIGLIFEEMLLEKIKGVNSSLSIVRIDNGIKKRAIDGEYQSETEPGHPDPHIWLSPSLLKIQAKNIVNSLKEIDQMNSSIYQKNYLNLVDELDSLEQYIKGQLLPYRGESILLYHPVLGYFTDSYGLRQLMVEVEEKSPTARQLRELIDEVKKDNIREVFVQSQLAVKSGEVIAHAINGKVVVIDPLKRDVINNLREIANTIRDVLLDRRSREGKEDVHR